MATKGFNRITCPAGWGVNLVWSGLQVTGRSGFESHREPNIFVSIFGDLKSLTTAMRQFMLQRLNLVLLLIRQIRLCANYANSLKDEEGYINRKCHRICMELRWKIILEKTTLSTPVEDSNLGLPIIGSLVYCENSALDHRATKAELMCAWLTANNGEMWFDPGRVYKRVEYAKLFKYPRTIMSRGIWSERGRGPGHLTSSRWPLPHPDPDKGISP
uniref:Uncharacterized protein n=1 Tax=Timema bartmani TaxID=61472 RepID=A0A7R9F333_9NEOP|nr:unnamed protein product [Timema bartmani]